MTSRARAQLATVQRLYTALQDLQENGHGKPKSPTYHTLEGQIAEASAVFRALTEPVPRRRQGEA